MTDWHFAPADDRDSDDPEFIIDPVFSDDGNHGGDRDDRHRGMTIEGSYEVRTPADVAAINPEEEVPL